MTIGFRCPKCAMLLPETEGTAVLSCACSRYPQIDGVPTIKISQEANEEIETAARAIETGGRCGAIEWMRKWWDDNQCSLEALAGIVTTDNISDGRTFIEDWQQFAGTGREDYFILRWACPSFLCNLPLLPLFAGKRVLDLGCGVGHLAHLLSLVSPSVEIVAADGTLLHNLVLRKYFAPNATCVCLDLEDVLPFSEMSFDLIIMNDCFHYVSNKERLLSEAFRVLSDDGIIALVHVHDPRNLSGERVPGEPIEPRECSKLIFEIQPSAFTGFLGEREFLERYFRGYQKSALFHLKRAWEIAAGPYLMFSSKTDFFTN